ncbi:chemotaxis protein CheA [Perlucidibaca aquatica]|uniref:chemotaxis protein CheA n=1 Tax=Perlucidibaca aquatica TaxID=1852776 RepID=UPI00083B893D|nr:chemotaxis protein CheW [Perlucidibaca aquatica]
MSFDDDLSEFHAIFFEEAAEHLASLETLLLSLDLNQPDSEKLNAIFRAAHSIKGSASTFGFPDMASVTHDLETLLDRVRKQELQLCERIIDITLVARDVLLDQLAAHQGGEQVPEQRVTDVIAKIRAIANEEESALVLAAPEVSDGTASVESNVVALDVKVATESKQQAAAPASESSSIRVSIERVDQLINLVGELVITQSMLAQTAQLNQVTDEPIDYERLQERLQQLERNTRELQESVMSIRMLPVSSVFSRFPRLVRDLAGKLNKQIELRTVGEGTEIDRGVIEKITDPLTHLIRNSVDHGIETVDERIAAGKPVKGLVTLTACHQGGSVVIEIRDDGRGLNRDKLLAKARERNVFVPDNPSDQDVWQLIFAPGFSTAETVTDVSGRGVGMDVVRRNIEQLGGRVELTSVTGKGTTISIRLPLTLAIMDGMSVGIGDNTYIVPLTTIIESLRPRQEDVKTVASTGRVVFVRGEYLPLVALHEVFGLTPISNRPEQGILIIVDTECGRAALFVDELLGQRQVVIKSLESNYRKVPGISAATIMGDGSVSMILDVSEVVRLAKRPPLACAV